MSYKILKKSVGSLAQVCDGAIEKDGSGFNKPDSHFGHKLAETELWKRAWAVKAYDMIHKYKNQLEIYGIDYDSIPDPFDGDSDFPNDDGNEYISWEDFLTFEWSEPKEKKIHGILWKVQTISWELAFWSFYRKNKQKLKDMNIVLNYPLPQLVKRLECLEDNIITIEGIQDILLTKTPKYVKKLEKYVRTILADDLVGFWELWAVKKPELKALGITCAKDGYNYAEPQWVVNWWTTNEDPFQLPTDDNDFDYETDVEYKPIDFSDTILYEYQRPHAVKLAKSLTDYNVAADTSSTGTGKTFTAIAICQKLNLKFLVICPKAVIPAWRTSVEFIKADELNQGIVNYELIRTGKYIRYYKSKSRRTDKITGIKDFYEVEKRELCPFINVEKNTKKGKYEPTWLISWNIPEDMVIIWDEAHRCKNKSINSQMMIASTDAEAKQLLLTATLGADPRKMVGTAKALGLYDEPWEFYTKFLTEHNCVKEMVKMYPYREAWQYKGGTYGMKKIHEEIKDKIDGMNADELREKGLFPKTVIYAENYNLNGNNGKVEKIYAEMFKRIRELQSIKESLELNKEENRLGILQKAQQQVELLKVPVMVDLAKDYVASGHSVAIFVNYVDTVHAFVESLMKTKVNGEYIMKTPTTIWGGITAKSKEENRLKFENNEERVIVCNMVASKEGIDLHDKYHKHKRISLITPNYSAQVLKQVLGRIDRAGGTDTQQYIVYGMGTVEEKICAIVKRKLRNIDALNDGDVNPVNLF